MASEKRLIDVGKAIHDMCQACSMAAPGIECKPKHCSLVDALRNIPTVDAEEVVHGRWEKGREPNWQMPMCSACGNQTTSRYKYCPNCGAKMDGGVQRD